MFSEEFFVSIIRVYLARIHKCLCIYQKCQSNLSGFNISVPYLRVSPLPSAYVNLCVSLKKPTYQHLSQPFFIRSIHHSLIENFSGNKSCLCGDSDWIITIQFRSDGKPNQLII